MVETISVTAPPVPKAVVVTSPAKQVPKGGQWIKIHNPQTHSKLKNLQKMLNFNSSNFEQFFPPNASQVFFRENAMLYSIIFLFFYY